MIAAAGGSGAAPAWGRRRGPAATALLVAQRHEREREAVDVGGELAHEHVALAEQQQVDEHRRGIGVAVDLVRVRVKARVRVRVRVRVRARVSLLPLGQRREQRGVLSLR